MRSNHFLIIATLMGMLAVILGAFGAHGLEKLLDTHMLKRFHTGVEYQFYHCAALLAVGLLWKNQQDRWLASSGYAFSVGILLFSGSLYLYAITGMTAIAMITPFGGMAFIIGWLCLLRYLLKY